MPNSACCLGVAPIPQLHLAGSYGIKLNGAEVRPPHDWLSTVRRLKKSLNFHCREETYDVIVTAGGFSSKAINPNHITELLRERHSSI
jgi:hypothetical protein